MNRWKRVAASLVRLAVDQKGRPEGNVAREKLKIILEKHPEARSYRPVVEFMRLELAGRGFRVPGRQRVSPMTVREFHGMRRAGVDTDGSWTAGSFEKARRQMEADLRQRMADIMAGAMGSVAEEVRSFGRSVEETFDSTSTTAGGSGGFRVVRDAPNDRR